MYRFAMESLYKWKESPYRKPLIIEGARQVGKTETIRRFGESNYSSFIEINFYEEPNIRRSSVTDMVRLK